MAEKKRESAAQMIQRQISQFTRVEKAFYGSIVLTAIILAVCIVFMQTKLLQVQQDMTEINSQINQKQTQLNDAKQEVNELGRKSRLAELASSQSMTQQNGNLRKATPSSSTE